MIQLSGLSLPDSSNFVHPVALSAYADDVSSQGDIECLQNTLSMYEKTSSAQVNRGKSKALLVGQWRNQAVPRLLGGLEWEREELKVLGVFLGTEGFQMMNWKGVQEKVCARLSKRKWLLPQLS